MGWLLEPAVLGALAAASVLLFVASIVGVPFFLVRMPSDYFSRRERNRLGLDVPTRARWRRAAELAKNLLGILLLVAGVAMLVLPGQGVLTLFVALLLVDFPGKRKLQRRIVARPRVLGAINALRRRAGQPPLERELLIKGRRSD